jgi:hypothetical protein
MSMRSFSGCATHGVLEIQILKIVMLADANYHLITRVHVDTAPKAMVQPAILDVISRNRNSRTVRSRSAGTQGGEDRGAQRSTEAGCSTERGCCNSPIRCHRNHWSSFPFHQYVEGAKKATFRRAARRRCERRCEQARWS